VIEKASPHVVLDLRRSLSQATEQQRHIVSLSQEKDRRNRIALPMDAKADRIRRRRRVMWYGNVFCLRIQIDRIHVEPLELNIVVT
jgi:hypothetical protein